jgi:hypothetical protein
MSIWQDVSYKHKSGVWERNIHTGEEREVKPAATLPADKVVPLEEHVVIKPKLAPKKNWKNNAA